MTQTTTAQLASTAQLTGVRADSGLATILFVALFGAGLIFAAGFASSATLHDAAHDTRHSVGFPCH